MGAHVDRAWPETSTQISIGDGVKKVFLSASGTGEGMWVRVSSIYTWGVIGELTSDPVETYRPPIKKGDLVAVNLFEMIDWIREPNREP